MCIRDSYNGKPSKFGANNSSGGSTKPVSYTHLDVYKRQGFDDEVLAKKRRSRQFRKLEILCFEIGEKRMFEQVEAPRRENGFCRFPNS